MKFKYFDTEERAKQQRINQIKEMQNTTKEQDDPKYYEILERKVKGILDTDADLRRSLKEKGEYETVKWIYKEILHEIGINDWMSCPKKTLQI